MGRSKGGSKKRKGNEVELVNPNNLRFSCEDGNIPEWLLVELLIRLPVKSVFRFKLVSTKWLSIISDSYFMRVYVSRASSLSQQPWTIVAALMYHKDSLFSYLDYELLKDLSVKPSLCVIGVPPIHQPQETGTYLICGVSNGLVLYWQFTGLPYDFVDRDYYICNPLTGHCIALPPLASRLAWCGWGFHAHVEDGFLKSYRVVHVETPIRGSNWLKFQVYVSEIGEWKEFTVPGDFFPLYIYKPAAVLNGILHWIARGHGIIAHDPYQNPENMHVIAFPGDSLKDDEFSYLCVKLGKLRYFEVDVLPGVAFPSLKVWVLNDYSSGDWCLLHDISHVNVQYDANFPSQISSIRPMYFHPFDPDIVYLGCEGSCLSYNIMTRELHVEDEFFRHTKYVVCKSHGWWVPSYLFVIPHWPISIPRHSHGAIEG